MTDLLYSDIEEDLRASVRALLADRAAPATVLARVEGPEPVDMSLWRALGIDLGCAGLPVPAAAGGAGASWRETAVVLEELGRAAAPVPFLGSAVLATAALLAVDDQTLLPDLAGGTRTATLAVPFGTAPGPGPAGTAPGPGPAGTPGSAGWTVTAHRDELTGTVRGVADARTADVLLVPTAAGLFAVAATDVTTTPIVTLDLTRPLCDLVLDGAAGHRLGDVEPAVQRALTAGAALLAAEQLGVAEWCLATTVAYVRTRRQFARPIGSYQAIKHRLADLWVAVSQARAVSRYAAGCLADDDPDLATAAALAQAWCSPIAVQAAEACVQLHGGTGFTWEHPAHLYLKRAKSAAIAFGTPDRHRATLAGLVNLPGPAHA